MSAPLRILFVTHSFPPSDQPEANLGGMQRVAVDLFETLSARDDVIIVPLALRTSWESTHRKAPFFILKLFWQIPSLVKRQKIDVVLFSSMVTAMTAPRLSKYFGSSGPPLTAIVHGRDVTLPNALYQRVVRRIFRSINGILPVSSATGEQCVRRGLDPNKVFVVPNGIHLSRLNNPVSKKEARKRLCVSHDITLLPETQLVLCSVGRQVERKGFAWFIRNVMPGLPTSVSYWLGGDGPEADKIQSVVKEKNLQNRVFPLGRLSEEDLAYMYRASDLFVMPNIPVAGDMEGFGVVLLEAGQSGLPAVAANLEGIRDVISEGQNGHLLESGNEDAFISSISSYLGNPVKLADASEAAVSFVRDTFSWPRVADRCIEVLRSIKK